MEGKRGVVCAGLLMLVFLPAAVGFAETPADRRAIRDILQNFEEAYVEENIDLIDKVLSESNYSLVVRKGDDPGRVNVLNKEQTLAVMQRGWRMFDYLEHRHTNLDIEFHGPLATTRSTIHDKFASGRTKQSPVYHIIAKESEGWRVVFTSGLLAE